MHLRHAGFGFDLQTLSLLPLLLVIAVACSKKSDSPQPNRSLPAPPQASATTVDEAAAPKRACPEDMIRISGGSLKPDGMEPAVRVESFCIDTTEVTVAAYRECKSCTPPDTLGSACNWEETKRDDHPVNCVTWMQADAYCKSLNKRLPTEEEWEFAASGSEEQTYPWGNTAPAGQLCWHRGHIQAKPSHNREVTCPVGAYPSGRSPFGIDDMAGNVREWTSSEYDVKKKPDEKSHPGARVVRGSGWGDEPPVRNGLRAWSKPTDHFDDLGFRCAQ